MYLLYYKLLLLLNVHNDFNYLKRIISASSYFYDSIYIKCYVPISETFIG